METPPGSARERGGGGSARRVAGGDESIAPQPGEALEDDDEPWNAPALYREAPADVSVVPGELYAEWDYVTGRYIDRAVTVHSVRVAAGDAAWARDFLNDHSALVRSVRQRFERLRARRIRDRQQPDGDELDLAACVRAMVDWRIGSSSDGRLYVATRSTRRPLAIALLVDVSGSTDDSISDTLRMIDVEKMTLLLASEALSALGDRYAILTFTGHGPHGVRVDTVKDFAEANGELVRRRIATLSPGGFTRLGAAIRHATALLGREHARHRLLLILSDGRPNDLGRYLAEYGVEDSRQAINEARAQGIYPFCLNIDREGSEYLARIFGQSGYATIRQPDQLPLALLKAVRTLIAS
jgi:Nitric oxide reductase activation protein